MCIYSWLISLEAFSYITLNSLKLNDKMLLRLSDIFIYYFHHHVLKCNICVSRKTEV